MEKSFSSPGPHIPWKRISWFMPLQKIVTIKKLEEDRNTMLANFTSINRDLKQLNYTTSHDLGAPANSLLSLFELIEVSKITDT